MDLAKESLEIKRKTLENFIEKGLYPYSKFYLQGLKKQEEVIMPIIFQPLVW